MSSWQKYKKIFIDEGQNTSSGEKSSWQRYKESVIQDEEERKRREEERRRQEEQRKEEAKKQEEKRQEIVNKQASQKADKIVNDINSGKDLSELQKEYGNLSATEQAALAKKAQETANSSAGKLRDMQNKQPETPLYSKKTLKKEEGIKLKSTTAKKLEDIRKDNIEKEKKALGTVADVGLNALEGFAGVGEKTADFLASGIAEAADWTGHDEYAENLRRYIGSGKGNIFTDTLQKGEDALGDYSWSGDTLDQMFSGVGQTGAYVSLNAIPGAGQALSTGAMFTNAAGGELANLYGSEDYEKGNLRKGKIWGKALGSGLVEAISERLLGYFGSSGGVDKKAANYLSNMASTSLGKILARQGVNATAEGVEEVISYTGNYLLDSVIDYVDKKTGGTGEALRKPWNWKDLWQEAFTAAGSAFIMGGMDTAVTANSVNGTSVSDTINKTAQKMDLNAQLESLQSQEEKLENRLGKKITQQEAGNILEELQQIQGQKANIQTQLETLPTASQTQNIPQEIEVAPRAGQAIEQIEVAPAATQENTYSNKLRQTATEEINNSNIDSDEKRVMLEALDNLDTVSDADISDIRRVLTEIKKSQQLETKGNFKNDQARRQTYMKYKNDTSTYDSTVVDEVLSLPKLKENRNGRRTVKQWLTAADEIGKNIANLSNEEIEQIAYKSWFDLQPTKNITQYDNVEKQHVNFQKLTSDEWINTINNAVNEARAKQTSNNKQDTLKESKVRDKNGNLLDLYHGTDAEFENFENIETEPGYWFTEDKEYALSHGKNLKTVNLDLKNPIDLNTTEGEEKLWKYAREFFNKSNVTEKEILSNKFKDYLQNKGYDGMIWDHDGKNTYIAFNSNQIIPVVNEARANNEVQDMETQNNEISFNLPKEISIKDSQGREIDHQIHTYSTDAYSGQVNMIKEFQDEDGNTIAKIAYNYFDDEINIDLIETEPEYRRKGLATRLLQDLKKDAAEEGVKINYGYTSEEGTKLLQSLEKKNNQVQENAVETTLPTAKENKINIEAPTDLVESAKQQGFKYKDMNLEQVQKALENKGIKSRFDATEFSNENEGAKWKLTRNEDGTVIREIILNPKANEETVIQEMAIHELTHDIVAKNTKTSENLYKEVKQWLEKDSDYQEQLSNLKEIYGEELAEEEAIAKTLQTKFGTQEEINNLVNYNPSMARKIYDWVVDKLNKITGGKIEKLYWEDVRNKFERAYNEEGNYSKSSERFDIREDEKLGRYWNVEDSKDIFKGLTKTKDLQNEAYKYILNGNDNFEYITDKIDNKQVRFARISAQEYVYGRNAKDLNKEQYNQKMRTAPSIDDLINNADITYHSPLTHKSSLFKDGFNNYQGKVGIDNNIFQYIVRVGKAQNDNLFYDLSLEYLGNKNGTEIKVPGVKNTSLIKNSVPNNSITSSKQNVNTTDYNMQKSQNNTQDNQGKTLSKVQQERYKDISEKLKDENGNIKRYYHGTQRGDRVGNIFDPQKATSGPMAFFTDNADIAKSYSENKKDTSLSRDYDTEWDLFKAQNKDLDSYWRSLSFEKRKAMREKGYNVGFNDDYELEFKENASKNSFGSHYADELSRNGNNPIKALYDTFVNGGFWIGEDVGNFQKVLDYIGVEDSSYLDPYKMDSKVYEVYLNIKNPFDTSEISDNMLAQFKEAAKNAKQGEQYSADMWDKSNIKPEEWIERLEDDLKDGTTHAWTSIPDWVTNVLKNNGYDGIVDTGGKNGGVSHQVVIPFYSEQIKNIDNTNPTDNPDIRYSGNANFDKYLENRIGKEGTRTTLGELKPLESPTGNQSLATATNKVEQKQIAKVLDEPVTKAKEKSRAWAIAKANLIDKGIVFEELSRKTKNRELQGKWDYSLMSTARGQDAIGKARYENNYDTKTSKQISKSLEDIRTEVGKNTSDFQNYMYHQLNIDRMTLQDRFGTDNKPVFGDDISAEYSKRKVAEFEKAHPEFKEYAQDVYDFLDANKKELVDRGVISQELSDKLAEMYPHYVPISRVDTNGLAIKVPLDTFKTGVNTPLQRATGGSSDMQPLFQTIANRTMQTYRASARNSFGVELMNTLDSIRESTKTDVDSIIDQIGDESVELLKEGKNGQNPTFTVFNNGEKTTFEITKDMYDALKPQSEFIKNINNSMIAKAGRTISNVRRGVLTEYNPVFSITNAIKDAQDVVVNSQHPAKTYAKIPEAYAQIMKKGYWYNEYIQNGGNQNSYFVEGEFLSDKKQSKLKTAVTIPFEIISKVNNVIEMSPRLAEYIASREAGRSIETSMLDAARVTTNFKAGGDITKTLNRNGATFLNASVQGFQQQIRNIQEANAKGLKGYAVLATKYAIAGLPAAILNGLIWKDDKDYNELQDYAKDNYYIIAKYGDGKFIRIPKGRVAATIQKIVSNATEYLTDDKKTLDIDNLSKDFWEDIKFAQDNVAPNNPLDNNVISPIIQAIRNKTWYGTDLVPTRLQNKPKKEQYDETTDSLSIWLGDKLNVSPYKINYLLDQYGGGVADIALPRMTKQAENNMITDKFTTDSVMKNKYPGEFYDRLDELKIKANSIDAKDEDVLKYKYNSSISGQMSKLYAEKREIQNSDITDKQKKEKLKVVQEKINKLAKDALEGTDTAKISGNTATIKDTQYYKVTSSNEWNKVTDAEKQKNKDISLKTYADYKNKTVGKSKDSEQIQVLLSSSYSNKEKLALYENYVNPKDSTLSIAKNSNINIDEYLKYKTQNFSADKIDDGTLSGKSISGSKKEKVFNYINNMNITYMQKLMLYGTEYTLSDSEQKQIATYINSLSITKDEKLEMLSKMKGFTIYKNGSYKY